MKTIYIYSASDRNNYGDLLFPILLKQYFSSKGKFKYEIIGNRKSNLSKSGALKTDSYKTLFNNDKCKKDNILIIAGGEVLSANWAIILSFISPLFFEIYYRLPIKNFLNNIGRLLIGHKDEFQPFVPTGNFLLRNYSIIFNSVGGSISNDYNNIQTVKKSMQNATYASFRDSVVADQIAQITDSKPVLCPDSAIIMSDCFNDVIGCDFSNYIIFQVGYYKSLNYLEVIGEELVKLQKNTNKKILLLPIGQCSGHRDSKALKKIERICNSKQIEYINPRNIKTTMKFIANSSLFIGTSLHGVITAMAYNVPYLGLNPNIKKLNNYLQTWAIDDLNKSIEFNEIFKAAFKALNVPYEALVENSQNQKVLVYKSLDIITAKIEELE